MICMHFADQTHTHSLQTSVSNEVTKAFFTLQLSQRVLFSSAGLGSGVSTLTPLESLLPTALPHGVIAHRNGGHDIDCEYGKQSRGRVQGGAELGHSADINSTD